MSHPKAKRHLLDEMEAGPSSKGDSSKKSKLDSNQISTKSSKDTNQLRQKGKEPKLNFRKCKSKTTSRLGHNNNATMVTGKSKSSRSNLQGVKHGKQTAVSATLKFTPIIQTRKMKAAMTVMDKNMSDKEIHDQRELDRLNAIDKLTSSEIVDGNGALSDSEEMCNDGVDLSINGSDIDGRSSDEEVNDNHEPGEISSNEEECDPDPSPVRFHRVALKVVKVARTDRGQGYHKHDTDTSAACVQGSEI